MERPQIKLYHYPATRSARVKWMLHEVLDDDFEVEIVPVYEGKQYEAEYLSKNPNHNVPTLEVRMPNGRSMHMIESGAMVAFLGDAFPEKGLAPATEPAFVKAFADAGGFQIEAPDGSELLDRFTG